MVRPKYKFSNGQLCMTCIHSPVNPLILEIREEYVSWNLKMEKCGPRCFTA